MEVKDRGGGVWSDTAIPLYREPSGGKATRRVPRDRESLKHENKALVPSEYRSADYVIRK